MSIESYKNKKCLIIYFSRADENYNVGYIEKGNTEKVAEYIKDFIDVDLFKVEGVKGYSPKYSVCIKEARKRQNLDEDLELKEYLDDISKYDVIFIGSPVYWGLMPQELVVQLRRLNFTGKTVKIFTTHEGSGLASIPAQVKRVCKGAKILDYNLAITGSKVDISKNKVENWL